LNRGKNALIEDMWPDLREEIMWEFAMMLRKPTDKHLIPPTVKLTWLGRGRAFLRYHLQPYDKSIWGKLRDPVFIIFKALACLPHSAASPLFFAFLFLVIDKRDEFQLVDFIFYFKGMQFISHGVVRTLMGFVLYFSCVTAPAHDYEHYCEKGGPEWQENLKSFC